MPFTNPFDAQLQFASLKLCITKITFVLVNMINNEKKVRGDESDFFVSRRVRKKYVETLMSRNKFKDEVFAPTQMDVGQSNALFYVFQVIQHYSVILKRHTEQSSI